VAVLAPHDTSRPKAARPASGGWGLLASLQSAWSQRAPQQPAQRVEELVQQADALDAQREQAAAALQAAPSNTSGSTASSGTTAPPAAFADIRAFLRPVGVMETRYVRALSSLCALTYHLDKLTPSALLRRHRLKLVTTSKVCDLRLREPPANPAAMLEEGDAMAADPVALLKAAGVETPEAQAEAAAAVRADALSTVDLAAAAAGAAPAVSKPAAGPSPVDAVAASLSAAAAAASAAASSAAQGVYTAAVPYAEALANNITPFTASVTASLPVQNVAAQLQSAAAAGHSSAVATVATVSAALESTWGRDRLPKECQSPTEWFIADDESQHIRYFVIQGSDNLDHWRVNLTFDPVPFEDPALGVKVHRGVYEAAQQLYDRFLPLVQDHLASSPFAKVSFTGHSLGGSLGTVLLLMYVRRGVLPILALTPVYTFGAPAVFCEGGAGGGACACRAGSSCGSGGILQSLGLPEGAIRNVLMSFDIVPRAFACDYSLVADLLKRVSDAFREHACLNGDRAVMFDFVGKVMVLQPEAGATFVARGERPHPMLPPQPGLFVLREPTPMSTVAATLQQDAGFVRDAVNHAISNLPAAVAAAAAGPDGITAPPPAVAAALAPAATPKAASKAGAGSGKGSAKASKPRAPVRSAREAALELMNVPHPLDILADAAAYGSDGAISRYHNPDNYTRALGGVLRHRHAWRRLAKNAARVGIRYFAPVLDPAQLRKEFAPAAPAPAAGAQAAPADSAPVAPAHAADRRLVRGGGKQSLLTRLSPRGGSPRA
jgi:hypothetical protein